MSRGEQCDEVDYVSNQMNTSLYAPNCGKEHFGIQTDMRRKLTTPKKKAIAVQTCKPKDQYKDDWEKSLVYRTALRLEAGKRGVEFEDPISDNENHDDDTSTQNSLQRATP
jgi:hypothetical protein